MNNVWILVCDAGRGRLFETRGDNPAWHLLEVFGNADSRAKVEQTGDHSSRDVEKRHFVHSMVTMLDQAMRSKRFDRWVLVAPPHALGMMKNDLTPELTKHLMTTVDKDLTHIDVADLTERLGETVRIPLDERDNAKHAH